MSLFFSTYCKQLSLYLSLFLSTTLVFFLLLLQSHYLLFLSNIDSCLKPSKPNTASSQKCPFILHRFLILLPFALQYSLASSFSLTLHHCVHTNVCSFQNEMDLNRKKWVGWMIKMKELFLLIFRKVITYSMMTVTIDGSNIHVASSSSIENRNEINFGRVL